MEGINPTLTLLVMVLGLSGNARDTADNAAAAIERETGCPIPIIVGAAAKEEIWSDAFWDSAAVPAVLPDKIEPNWADLAAPGPETAPLSEDARPAFDLESDSIVRRPVPTGVSMLAADAAPDPCMQ
jgi:hypothetical protein